MRKTTKGEGKIEVLRGPEAEVLNQHFAKLGKYAVSDFNDEEREALDHDLDAVRAPVDEPETRGDIKQSGGEDA